jgi:hypothetical protein
MAAKSSEAASAAPVPFSSNIGDASAILDFIFDPRKEYIAGVPAAAPGEANSGVDDAGLSLAHGAVPYPVPSTCIFLCRQSSDICTS